MPTLFHARLIFGTSLLPCVELYRGNRHELEPRFFACRHRGSSRPLSLRDSGDRYELQSEPLGGLPNGASGCVRKLGALARRHFNVPSAGQGGARRKVRAAASACRVPRRRAFGAHRRKSFRTAGDAVVPRSRWTKPRGASVRRDDTEHHSLPPVDMRARSRQRAREYDLQWQHRSGMPTAHIRGQPNRTERSARKTNRSMEKAQHGAKPQKGRLSDLGRTT